MEIHYEYLPKEYPVSVHLPYYRNSGDRGCYYHWHELLEIYYVLDGGVRLLLGDKAEWVHKGELGIVNWCQPHRSLNFLDNTAYLVVKVDMHSNLFPASLRKLHFNSIIPCNDAICSVFTRMVEEAISPDKETHHINLGYAVTLMGLLSRANATVAPTPENKEFEHTRKIFSFIHEHYAENFSLQDMAEELNISKSHMCRVFMSNTGITINHYLNQTRCDAAIHLISNGSSISDAAQAVGYSDYNYFSRVFKKIMGVSPLKMKKSGLASTI